MGQASQLLMRRVRKEVMEGDTAKVQRDLADGERFALVDVRETTEWNEGHLPDALHVPRGVGAAAALYLAAAGVGTVGLVDADVVEASNLQRQIIHSTARVGRRKTESARETIQGLNPDVKVVLHDEWLDKSNVARIIADYDVIVDGTDNFPTRYLLNDASVIADKPVVHGSVFRFEGQVTVFQPHDGPCYRCLFP